MKILPCEELVGQNQNFMMKDEIFPALIKTKGWKMDKWLVI